MIAEGILPSPCPQGHLAALPTDEPGVWVCGACGGGRFTDHDPPTEDAVCQGHGPRKSYCASNRQHLAFEASLLRRSWSALRETA